MVRLDVADRRIEWLNADSEWRDESRWTLTKALLTYPARQTETLTTLLDRPDSVIEQWDGLTAGSTGGRHRRGRRACALGFRSLGEPYDTGASLHVPSYERLFRVFSNVLPGVSLTGDAAADADLVIDAIRRGHVYTAIDGWVARRHAFVHSDRRRLRVLSPGTSYRACENDAER